MRKTGAKMLMRIKFGNRYICQRSTEKFRLSYFLLIFVILTPASIFHFLPFSLYFFVALRLMVLSALLLERKIVANSFIIVLFAFQSIFIVSDIFNHSGFNNHLSYLLINLLLCCLITAYVGEEKKRSLLYSAIITLRIFILIQLLTKFLYPEGLYSNELIRSIEQYFLENDNSAMPYVYCLMILSVYFKRYYENTNYCSIIDNLLCVTLTVYAWSATGVVVVVLIFVSIYISKLRIKGSRLIFVILLFLVIGLFSSIIFNGEIAIPFVNELSTALGKDGSFSGRTYIWLQALKIIMVHPLFGSGSSPITRTIISLGGTKNMGAHNQILQYAIGGGVFSLMVLVLLVVVSLKQNNKSYIKEKRELLLFLYFSTVSVFIGMQMEIYSSGWILMFCLALCYSVNNNMRLYVRD